MKHIQHPDRIYPRFAVGQRVRNEYGRPLTVLRQLDCQVWVREEFGHYHPTKLWPVEKKTR